MRCRVGVIWMAVAMLSLIDLVLCHRLQLSFTNWRGALCWPGPGWAQWRCSTACRDAASACST
ncbi:MAG: hypothetical protein ACREE2_16460 [Stellaceae bacterium]